MLIIDIITHLMLIVIELLMLLEYERDHQKYIYLHELTVIELISVHSKTNQFNQILHEQFYINLTNNNA